MFAIALGFEAAPIDDMLAFHTVFGKKLFPIFPCMRLLPWVMVRKRNAASPACEPRAPELPDFIDAVELVIT